MKTPRLPDSALERSVLVVAHPDDEILWFGSIVKDVGHIIICFLDDPTSPKIALARTRCLHDHPLREKITCLELPETGIFNQAFWPHPETTEFGLKIDGSAATAQNYERRARELNELLKPLLSNAENIFTHNPWGEYGHAEHVMVHRIVMSLAETNGAAIWHSNYVSYWSQPLMEKYLSNSHLEYHQNDVDCAAMLELAQHYKKCKAWTWMDDYSWFPQECFIRGPLSLVNSADGGWLFPLNYIRISSLQTIRKPVEQTLLARLKGKLSRILGQFQADK